LVSPFSKLKILSAFIITSDSSKEKAPFDCACLNAAFIVKIISASDPSFTFVKKV
jgi:hypothetical protein